MKRRNTSFFLFTLGAAFTLLLSACPAGPSYTGDTNYPTCGTTADCSPGEACSDQGYCLPRLTPESGIGIELVPKEVHKDAQDGLVQVEYSPEQLSLDADGRVVVTYAAPVTLEGSVSVPAAPLTNEGFSQFQSRVTFWRASRIPGRPRVSYSSTLAFDMTNAPQDGMAVLQYSLALPGGFVYNARAVPDGGYETALPPSADVTIDLNDVTGTYQRDFDFSQEDFLSAEGTVTDAMDVPLGGIQAQIVDSQGRRVSTVSVTDPDSGRFQVLFSKNLDPQDSYSIVLSPSDSVDMLLPKLQKPLSLPDSGPVPLGTIAYPPLRSERCTFQFRVVGKSSSGVSEPVAGAKVSFSTEFAYDDSGIASHAVDAVTDPDGTLSVQLISGANTESREYNVAVLPSVDSPYAATVDTVEISGCGGAASTIQLSERTSVVGVVRSVEEGPVPNLTVSAKPVVETSSQKAPTPASMMLESGHAPSATTTSDGMFYINLDPGRYDLELAPPAGSALPRWLVTGITIQEGTATKSLQITMPSPALLQGKVVNSEGQPVTGFLVRAYLVPPDCAKADWADCNQTAFLLSEGELHSDGTFSLVIPDNL